tara:strand:- start:766 stop:1146 length:381 start_codon:yes stop_codon:yes gene_type:complete
MATRSHIGKKLENGSIKYIYCHWDGQLNHNGKVLKEHYTDEAKIDALLELGNISILGEEIGEKQDFDNINAHNDKWCLAYGRDRGEPNTKAKQVTSIEDMLQQSYHYVWDNGVWKCYASQGRELVF